MVSGYSHFFRIFFLSQRIIVDQVAESRGAVLQPADHQTAEDDYENDSFAHGDEEGEDDPRHDAGDETTGRSSRSSATESSSEKVSED